MTRPTRDQPGNQATGDMPPRPAGRLILFRTSAFRIAAGYTLLFAVSALLLFWLVFQLTSNAMDRETSAAIDAEITSLAEQYDRFGLPGLAALVRQRAAGNPGRRSLYLLTDPRGRRIEGNLNAWPVGAQGERVGREAGGMIEFAIESPRGSTSTASRARARVFVLDGGFGLLVGRDLFERLRVQSQLMRAIVWAAGAMVLLGISGGLLVGWRSMARVGRMVSATDRVVASARQTGRRPATPSADSEKPQPTGREIGMGTQCDGDFPRTDDRGKRSREDRMVDASLSQRLPLSERGDELDQLASNVNAMLDRLEELLAGMRQVTDNVAHDLRGPLTRLKTRIEVTLLADPDPAVNPDAWRTAMEEAMAEANGLLATFNALLDIATAEAGSLRGAMQPVDLAAVARDLAELYRPAAEEAGLVLSYDGPGETDPPMPIRGHPHLLNQAVANLIDNAVKHGAPPGAVSPSTQPAESGCRLGIARGEALGRQTLDFDQDKALGQGIGMGTRWDRALPRRNNRGERSSCDETAGAPSEPATGSVAVSLRQDGEALVLQVADDGPGIPVADRTRALQRFVRLDQDRGRPGNGLGLSLVAATARLHRADLTLADNMPGLLISLRFHSVTSGEFPFNPTCAHKDDAREFSTSR